MQNILNSLVVFTLNVSIPVVYLVNGIIAPAFLNKPKIFLVEACRGHEELKAHQTESDGITRWTNTGADFYTVRSNIEGYKAFRDIETGTYFLQEIALFWEEYFQTESLDDIMTAVTSLYLIFSNT